jgi:hypothetical protein
VTVEDNIIQNGITGLDLGSSASTISQNLFQNLNSPGPASGTGVYADQFVAGGALTNDAITGNTFSDDDNGGIVLSSTDPADPASGFTIADNTFTGDGGGIFALNLTNSAIDQNVLASSTGDQLDLGEGVSGVSVASNVIENGAAVGVGVVAENTGAPPATGVTLTCNSVTGNLGAGLEVDTGAYTGTLDAGFNWWGSATGPTNSANPGGTGQPIADPDANVSFSPFLVDGTTSDPSSPGFHCEPGISIGDVTGSEGSTLVFTVTLSNPRPSAVTLDYATADGSDC